MLKVGKLRVTFGMAQEGHRDAGHKNAEPTGLGGFDGYSEAGHRDALPTERAGRG